MDDKKKVESAEEEISELNDEELEGVAGGIEIPPPLEPPAPISEEQLRELESNIPMF